MAICETLRQRRSVRPALRQRCGRGRMSAAAAAATKATLHTHSTSVYLIYYMETLRLCGGFACCFLYFFLSFFFVFIFVFVLLSACFFNDCCAPNLARPSRCCCCCCCLWSFLLLYFIMCCVIIMCCVCVCVCVPYRSRFDQQRLGKRKPSQVEQKHRLRRRRQRQTIGNETKLARRDAGKGSSSSDACVNAFLVYCLTFRVSLAQA